MLADEAFPGDPLVPICGHFDSGEGRGEY
jgi:hypothetical protein